MKFVGASFQGKPASLEEGPLKYRSAVLRREESASNCSRFVQIVKLILWIELIILVGWVGCLSLSHYNNYRSNDCRVSAIGCKPSEIDYGRIEAENSRERRGVPTTEDEREKCGRNANATRQKLDAFAAHFVSGESSDPTVAQLRWNFIESTISESMRVIVAHALVDAISTMIMDDNGMTNASLLYLIPDDNWPLLVQLLCEEFVNSTDSENRQRLAASGSPNGEMASEYRAIVESFYIDLRDCDRILLESLVSDHTINKRDKDAQRWKRESEPATQSLINCRDAEAQLLKERRERHEAIAAEIASDHQPIISTMILLNSIDSALSAKRPSEVTVEDHLLQDDSGLIPWKRFMSNASLELKKEFYMLIRDEFLELRNEKNEPSAWEGHDLGKAYRNWTDGLSILTQSENPEAVLNITIKFGKAFDLHYVEVEREDGFVDSEAPVFGKLTYLGAEPERLGVRRLRHILNGFVRLYFKAINRLEPCPPATDETSTQNRRVVNKRTTLPEAERESNTPRCWNGEQNRALFEERQTRLAALAVERATSKLEADDRDFLTAIESALNASSISEIHFGEKYTRPRMLMNAIIDLTSNASLELHKEVYAIMRDVFLQLRSLNNRSSPQWEGCDMTGILNNVSAGIDLPIIPTAKTTFSNFVRIGEAFKLRYVELQSREIGADTDQPVFGKFAYTGEQPEIMGIQHMRHILDAFVKAYFKIQDPSGMCNSSEPHDEAGPGSIPTRNKRTITSAPKPDRKHQKSSTVKCWNQEEDRVLLEERRARLETFTTRSGLGNEYERCTQQMFLGGIENALNATRTSEIQFVDELMERTMVLPSIHYLVTNASLELHKEGYELARDLFLEMHGLNHRGPEWEGWNQDDIGRNLTDAIFFSRSNMTLQSIFDNFVRFGRAFNLRYEKPENLASGDAPYGKFTYLGEGPEKLGLRHLRHTLDGFIRLFYKIQNPTTPGWCRSTVQTRATHSIEKRSVTADPNPESITTKCWSEEDKVLEEERLKRLEDFAQRAIIAEALRLRTNSFLESIEAALNATSASEIHIEDAGDRESMHVFIETLADNSSLELRKEGYEISRDLYLELYEFYNHNPEWDGYDKDQIESNLTASNVLSYKVSMQVTLNDVIVFSKAFNLRYEELGTRESGVETDKPVFGKFTYIGEEPEKLGVRHLRHILDAIVKLYFKTQDPSSLCNSVEQSSTGGGKDEKPTADPSPHATKTKCWSAEQDPVLLEERQERLEALANWREVKDMQHLEMKSYLDAIERALNATSTSGFNLDDRLSKAMSLLLYVQDRAPNSSLDLHKEGLKITRDLYLEMAKLNGHHSEWEGFDLNSIVNNLTVSGGMHRGYNGSPETMFNDFKKFSQAFNLRFEALEKKDSADEPDKPVFGKYIYVGEEPEKLGVKHLRHILDGFVRFYFKVQDPSTSGLCDSAPQTPANHAVEKRSAPVDPVPESGTTKCWSEEQDTILKEERLERLASFALRTDRNEKANAYTKTFLEDIDAALNSKNLSEIHFHNDPQQSPLLKYMEYLSENSSLETRKEVYEINRDLHLELFKLRMHCPEWDGYSLNRIGENLTARQIFAVNLTQEAIFNEIVTTSNAFNLRYEELGTRESGVAPNKPVFGKFAYAGEGPENRGVRNLRHILDAFAKFYFKTQEPSSVCKSETSAATPVSDGTNAKCWNVQDDPALLAERQERLRAYPTWNAKYQLEHSRRRNFLDAIGDALSAAKTSDIRTDFLTSAPIFAAIQNFAKNSSLELYKEGLELARDLYLEIDELKDRTSEWEGYDFDTILKNLTDSDKFDSHGATPAMMFSVIANFGRAFNLRYKELGKRDGTDEPDKPVFGKYIYLGEEPEKLGVKHLRHILDGLVRFYFKVQNPSTTDLCNFAVQTRAKRSVEERSVSVDPVPESALTKCWSDEQDKILEEERLERLGAFALRFDRKQRDYLYTKNFTEGVEAALNATSKSDCHFHDTRRSPLLIYMTYLSENSSLEIRKEAYEINRDLHLELFKFKMHSPEWDGYSLDRLADNISATHIFSNDMTYETMFNDIVTFSNAFNLRYEELGNRESGLEPNKPVFGKFSYVGEEPEDVGVRHIRHILDAFAKFYFKTQEPSSVCNGETSATTPASGATNARCWNVEDDPALLQERRERLEAYALWKQKYETEYLYMEKYMNTIGEALNATSPTEIQLDESVVRTTPILSFIESVAMNSSLELHKEGLEIARDMLLEIEELIDHTEEWEGYDFKAIENNMTESRHSDGYNPSKQITFKDIIDFGRAFNLRYDEIESGDISGKPVLGKFTYLGAEPEKLGVRHIRHLLDGFARFYFKVRNPSMAAACNSGAVGDGDTNTEQAL